MYELRPASYSPSWVDLISDLDLDLLRTFKQSPLTHLGRTEQTKLTMQEAVMFVQSCPEASVVIVVGSGISEEKENQVLPGSETIAEKHVEELLSIEAIPAKALASGAGPALPTEACCPLLVPIPVIGGSVVSIAQAAERLGHSCKGKT